MSIKSMVRGNLHRLGYDVVKWPGGNFPPSLDIQARLLKAYIGDLLEANPDFFFIQVGAHDGLQLDPIRESIVAYHLRGLLIEPQPDAFSRLRENYRSEPQLLFEQAAIGDEPGRLPFYSARPRGDSESWDVFSSFDRDHLRKLGVPEDRIESIDLEVITFSSLLQTHGIGEVTLLQVDTEGYDYRVVRSALDAGLRPRLINYEYTHLSRADRIACRRMLHQAGYRFADIGGDTLCLLGLGGPPPFGGAGDN